MLSLADLKLVEKSGTGLLRRVPQAWLRVSGPDAEAFLHGQCTQDLRGLKPGRARWALWLSLKGKVLGESLVLREVGEGEGWWLWSAHTSGETLRARLEEFLIADDVAVEDCGATGDWEQITLADAEAAEWLRAAGMDLDGIASGAWAKLGSGYVFAGRRGQPETWEWLRPVADAIPVPGWPELRPEDLVLGRIAAGVPAIPGEFGAGDLPQEAGLEAVAVSFTKGCYLGQEVMARLHAMGRVRRRLVRVAGEGPAPAAGASLGHAADGRRAGELRAAVDDGRGGWIGLAMVNLLGLDPAKALKLGPETSVGAGWSVVVLDGAEDGE